ncbi:MAG: hypothetical protein M3132_13550, partial [Actinomycetia bacterium]|nr:hypothetical protein [Actinomycetes bacterium]
AALQAAELEGTAGFRLPKPVLGYDPEPGKAEAILDKQMTEWTAHEAAADEAEVNLGEARNALSEAESHRAEAEAAFTTAKDTLEAARLALAACKGAAPAARSDEVGTSPPPVIPIPPQQPATMMPDEPDTKKCAKGDTNRRRLSQQRFTILGGAVEVSAPTAQWNTAFAGGKLSPSALAAISFDELLAYFEDLDHRQSAVTVRVTIPTVVVTVSCFQNLVCRNNDWVETGDVERVEERTPGDDIVFVHKSKDKKLTARMVVEAQAKIAELQADEDDPADFTCD